MAERSNFAGEIEPCSDRTKELRGRGLSANEAVLADMV